MTDWTIRRPRWEQEQPEAEAAVPADWKARGAKAATPKGAARPKPLPKPTRKKGPGLKDYAASAANTLVQMNPAALPLAAGEQAGRLAKGATAYARRTTPKQFKEDARTVAEVAPSVLAAIPGAVWDEAKEDPLGFAASLLPGYEAVTAVGKGAKLRSEGKADDARNVEQQAGLLETLNFIPLGGAGAKGGKKVAKAAAKAAERPAFAVKEVGDRLLVQRAGAVPKTTPAARGASLPELRALLSNPEVNQPAQIAQDYTLKQLGRDYDANFPAPKTSLQRQSGIARAFREAASENPDYKRAIFERYGAVMPEVVEQAGAQNYDQLTEAAYRQLAKEATQQFDELPVSMSYHHGSGEYDTPSAMLRDVLGEGNLNVFRGGDPHPYLSDIDPATGLTGNEQFRAVHDYFGHGTQGTTFRPGGEEAAYASHHQMLSPLAQMALLSETRGQNSLVNYSPLNVALLEARAPLLGQIADQERWLRMRGDPAGDDPVLARLRAQLRDIGGETQFAPQTPVLLPPEYLDPMTAGGMPDYLRGVIRPAAPTGPERAVHLSHTEGLTATDPSFYGTGHRGDDWAIKGAKGSPREHTSFYIGPEGAVVPERVVEAVSPFAYEAQLQGLYDIASDPEEIVRLARALNPGRTAIPDFARMVREYGYSGYRNPSFTGGQAAANVFDPVSGLRPIRKGPRGYAEGGEV